MAEDKTGRELNGLVKGRETEIGHALHKDANTHTHTHTHKCHLGREYLLL